jgi:hypothetical protein
MGELDAHHLSGVIAGMNELLVGYARVLTEQMISPRSATDYARAASATIPSTSTMIPRPVTAGLMGKRRRPAA